MPLALAAVLLPHVQAAPVSASGLLLFSIDGFSTYPIHITMLTGAHPAKHGIYSNVKFDPELKNAAGSALVCRRYSDDHSLGCRG
ncbi:MAG TPA: alkaline phosphatase family protein [Bryobacteraceae bacterium]|nr:alkaline phosphatase family protein [Bryobacteraceae bacterium]